MICGPVFGFGSLRSGLGAPSGVVPTMKGSGCRFKGEERKMGNEVADRLAGDSREALGTSCCRWTWPGRGWSAAYSDHDAAFSENKKLQIE